LLAALNDEFTLGTANDGEGLRLTTVVTGTYDGTSGEFNFAYAGHPRMLVWRARGEEFCQLGEGLENLPLGLITGEQYCQQSIRLNVGDMILAFSDGATEAHSPEGEQLTARGFLTLAQETLRSLTEPVSLAEFSQSLLSGIQAHRGGTELEDDVTLLTLRRVS
jgi:sigma-B regulation protein RsbU (phosphoserine phosphatase)